MEEIRFGTFPPEVWCHILAFVDDLTDFIRLKLTSRLFYQELASRDPFKAFDSSIDIPKDCLTYLRSTSTLHKGGSRPIEQNQTDQGAEVRVKLIVLGVFGVGKNTFVNSVAYGRFEERNPMGARGIAFVTKKFVDPDGITTKIDLWETAGQERFRNIHYVYYRAAGVVLLCFSIDNRGSLVELLNGFLPAAHQAYKSVAPKDQPLMHLLGLKSDLENQRAVSVSEAKIIARALHMKYFECSVKTMHHVNEVMEAIKEDVKTKPPVRPAPDKRPWCSIQ